MPIHTTFEIMLATDSVSYDQGDIVEVYRTNRFTNVEWNGASYTTAGGVLMPRTGYIHVRNVPTDVFRRIRRLTRRKYHDPLDPEDPHSGGERFRRRWQVQIDELATPVRNKLLADREITRTWIQFKNKTKHKVSGVYLADSHIGQSDPDPGP